MYICIHVRFLCNCYLGNYCSMRAHDSNITMFCWHKKWGSTEYKTWEHYETSGNECTEEQQSLLLQIWNSAIHTWGNECAVEQQSLLQQMQNSATHKWGNECQVQHCHQRLIWFSWVSLPQKTITYFGNNYSFICSFFDLSCRTYTLETSTPKQKKRALKCTTPEISPIKPSSPKIKAPSPNNCNLSYIAASAAMIALRATPAGIAEEISATTARR